MRSAKLYRYRLPVDSGVVLRGNHLKEREGFIIELKEDGRTGRGEVSPLAGFSPETTIQAGTQVQEQLALWSQEKDIDNYDAMYASVAFGVSTALHELKRLIPEEGNFTVAPLCSGDPDDLITKLQAMPEHNLAKVKVGLFEPCRDGLLVSTLLEVLPNLVLRLDANRSWTLEKAKDFASRIPPSLRQRIVYIEEPCASPSDSIAFAIDTGIAVGWDETLQQSLRDPNFRLEDLTGVKALIIKPTVIGSIERCQQLVEKAKRLGIKPVLSSSLETTLGLCQIARIAKWLIPDEIPGLDTYNFYQQQLETVWPGCELPVVPLEEQELIWYS